MATHYLHKAAPCRGACSKTEADCSFAHSIHAWRPKHPSMMCSNGTNCWYKETTCCRIHDGSLADKIRYARFHNMKFHIPYEPRVAAPAPAPVPQEVPLHQILHQLGNNIDEIRLNPSVPQEEPVPQPQEDPLHQLQLEKAMIQSEMELLNIMKKKLEVRILLFKMKASDYWEAGSAEMEF